MLEETYNHLEIEDKIYNFWKAINYLSLKKIIKKNIFL